MGYRKKYHCMCQTTVTASHALCSKKSCHDILMSKDFTPSFTPVDSLFVEPPPTRTCDFRSPRLKFPTAKHVSSVPLKIPFASGPIKVQ
jgi:hypothetical protein